MKKSIRNIHYAIIALILLLLFSLDYVAYSFSGTITQYICGFGIDYNSEGYASAKSEGIELACDICEDGFTMLKNENHTLPLSDTKINVFGWGGCDNGFIYMGDGSGYGGAERISLYEGLRRAGLELNESLCGQYNSLSYRRVTTNAMNTAASVYYRMYDAPLSFYTSELLAEARDFSSKAIVVISRRGGEGADLPKYQYDSSGNKNTNRQYLELTSDEESMLNVVLENFSDVVVIFNTVNIMEMGFIEDERIGAAIAMYTPGTSGAIALGNILLGKATPSGHLVDTAAYDITTSPAYVNMGADSSKTYANGSGNYVDYAEDIYVGYRWYETAYAEKFWDSYYAQATWGISGGYDDVVQFPFGYGLSYAEFSWTVESVSILEGSVLGQNDEITFKIFVENKADSLYSGKDVVQLYYSAPYTKGGIEKSSIELIAYAKTGLLEPGQGEELTLTASLRDMASYDCYDANNNGFMGYETEGGTYTLSLRTDAHSIAEITNADETAEYTYTVPKDGYRYETDEVTGTIVTNQFTTYINPISGATSTHTEPSLSSSSVSYSVDGADAEQNITYLTRADFAGTFPFTTQARQGKSDFWNTAWDVKDPVIYTDDEMPVTGSNATEYTLTDMLGVDYEDEKWDALVSQLDIQELAYLCAHGGYCTVEIASIGKPYCVDLDGPSGLNTGITGSDGGVAVNYPSATIIASTWDWKDAYQFGLAVGSEADALGINGWYAPGANIHRSPLGGRNFEYYSEDPLVAGTMTTYATLGAKENGLYAYVKHFAVNDSDAGRNGLCRWVTEQAMREIYLEPFEQAVKDGGAVAIMSSVDRIGSVRASGSYRLLTTVLREEWGFEGSVVSDYYQGGQCHDADECIRAGNDLMLNPDGRADLFDDLTSATAVNALKKSAKNILYTYVSTQYSKATSQGLDLSSVIGVRSAVYPWWIWILVLFNVLIVGILIFWGITVTVKSRKNSARDNTKNIADNTSEKD